MVKDDSLMVERASTIEESVRKLEAAEDRPLQAIARELVRALMDLHRDGLERVMEQARQAGPPGLALIDRLCDDEVVRHLLVLHDLHPQNLDQRVHEAVEKIRPGVTAKGGTIERVAVGDAGGVTVTLRVVDGGSGCGSPAATLDAVVREAIYEVAPDAVSVVVDVLEPSSAAFVPIASIRRRPTNESIGADVPVAEASATRS